MENSSRNAFVLFLAVVIAGSFAFAGGLVLGKRQERSVILGSPESGGGGSAAIQRAYNRILDSSVDPPASRDLSAGAIKGMVKVLKDADDPYAFFFSPESYDSFSEITTGEFSGIGVWLKETKQGLEVVSVLPDTPALAAGIKSGDVIEKIDDTDVIDINSDEAIAKIKGPEGSEVRLEIDRDGESLSYTIKRAAIELPNLQAKLRADGAGYIRLFGFAQRAGDQVREEVEKLTDQGAEGIILDLRDNGGGLFDEGVEVASAFIEDGEIVTYKDPEEEKTYDARGDAFEDIPLVVLVNKGTASASEIVAGALQDRGRAQLIGTRTYGKGSVQQVIELPDDSALKFTTAAYYTPSGKNLTGNGLRPDVSIHASPAEQLKRAVEVLDQVVASAGGAGG